MTQEKDGQRFIPIENQQSLVHLGSLDSFDITRGGVACAKLLLSYLERNNPKKLEKAIEIYEALIPYENFGGEYTSLEWLCRVLLAPEEARKEWLEVPLVNSFWHLWIDDDFDNLRTYLKYKYHIVEYDQSKDNTELKARMRFLEDFILFNNPDRERWENTRANMERFNLKEGMRVADVGCGPGYFTFKFADIVGPGGHVYATETNPRHLEFLRCYVAENQVQNVDIIESSFEGIGLDPEICVDMVYICSLYHNVYAAFTDPERDLFVGSIRQALRRGGKLIIVDNDLVSGKDLPYHGPYINKAMIVSQLWYYGFRLLDSYQFTPQRYVLIFEVCDLPAKTPEQDAGDDPTGILVRSAASLIRYRIIGTSTSGYTKRGKIWGRLMYEGITEGDREKLVRAYEGFSELWPQERIGDDYTAFLWIIRYYLADSKEQQDMSADPLVADYLDFFGGNGWDRMKQYLWYKFDLARPDDPDASNDTNYEYGGGEFPLPTLNIWNEYFIFNNPSRDTWEHTWDMLRFCDIRPGQRVADIGCGPGFFTWQFSKAVGEEGQVYATEISKNSLKFLKDFIARHSIKNIRPIVAKMNDACLDEDSVDVIFMCSMYHAVYITDIEFVKDQFVASLHKALRRGGRLIIVDNSITEPGVPAYYGPGIEPMLIVAQLGHYGFRLVDRWAAIPQRFVLVFEEVEGYTPPPERKDMNNARGKKGDLHQVLRPRRGLRGLLGGTRGRQGPIDDMRDGD